MGSATTGEILVEIVNPIISQAVENVSRSTTATLEIACIDEGVVEVGAGSTVELSRETSAYMEGSSVEQRSSQSDYDGESSGAFGSSGSDESLPAGMNMSPNLMAALGMAPEEIPTVETEWKPPDESGIEAAQKEGYSLAS